MLETINGQYTIKQILEENVDNFFRLYGDCVRDTVITNVTKVRNCGNRDKLGYSVYTCPDPKCSSKKHIVAHTCKSRFCNSCGKVKNDDWIVKSQDRLLNVPHKHLVFTIPSELWLLFRS
jgi:hypothetical protein